MKTFRISLLLISLLSLISCSEEYQVSKDLVGLWDIAVYQKVVYKENQVDLENSGTWEEKGKIEFNSNGTGYFNILEDLGPGVYTGTEDFTWTNTENTVTIITGTTTKVFTINERKDNYFDMEHEVANFYFSGSEPGVDYSLYERMVLEK